MTKEQFEAELTADGYQVFYGGFRANQENPEHIHPWHARLMVIGGEITITRDGKPEQFGVGDSCSVPANYSHSESAGPQGAAYIIGRKPA